MHGVPDLQRFPYVYVAGHIVLGKPGGRKSQEVFHLSKMLFE